MSEIKDKVETLLFMAKTPLTVADFQEVLKEDKILIEASLESLVQEYNQRVLQIIRVAGGYQMATRPEFHKIIEKFVNSPLEVTLSSAAMETLAIIAYRQPISRREVEHIRGVNSDAVVKSLTDKGLIKELGKGEGLGKQIVFGTTDLFLRHFGLNSTEELPPDPGMNYQLSLKKSPAETSVVAAAESATTAA